MYIPMAMPPESSEHTRKLAQRMLELTADGGADISECGVAALYVVAAYVAAIEDDLLREGVILDVSSTLARLVQANRTEEARTKKPGRRSQDEEAMTCNAARKTSDEQQTDE